MISIDKKTANNIAKKVVSTRYGIFLGFNLLVIIITSAFFKNDNQIYAITIISIFGFISSFIYLAFLIQEYKNIKLGGLCSECKKAKINC